MPRALEMRLRREASEKGLSGKRADAYVYGTMRKMGWKPKTHRWGNKLWGKM